MAMQEIEDALQKIWTNPKYKEISKGEHYVYPVIKPEVDILFIGINPSYNKDHDNVRFYEFTEKLLSIPYFKAFDEFAKGVRDFAGTSGVTWTHIDLLFFRETEQNKIHTILKETNGAAFIYEQLKVAEKLIIYAKPKVVIVCNALARLFLGKEQNPNAHQEKDRHIWLGYKFGEIDLEIGTYILDGKPWFFSGMLSGQRALDKGSLERLEWQVKVVLKKIKS
jgi:hypothetical protein